MREIIPTIVPESFESLLMRIHELREFASVIHIDAGDGKFVPNTTWLPKESDILPDADTISFEAHLMTEEPHQLGINYIKAGAKRVIAHFESFSDPSTISDTFKAWKEAGAEEVGLALVMDTSLDVIESHSTECDVILLMTINEIGVQGNVFEPGSLARIASLHERFPDLKIAVDGGITESNITALEEAGASRFCVGSAIARSDAPTTVYNRLAEGGDAI